MTRLKAISAAALLLSTALSGPGAAQAAEPYATPSSLCAIKDAALDKTPKARVVSLTAVPYYDFEHGYFLSDNACHDRVDGTGVVRIEAPRGKDLGDFPELMKLSSQDFLRANQGKHVRCRCVGRVSYTGHFPRFELLSIELLISEP
jgi:hypothetical protein